MRRLLPLSTLLCLVLTGNIRAQNAFHDALYIVENKKNIAVIQVKLANTAVKPSEINDSAAIKLANFNELSRFVNNPLDTSIHMNDMQLRENIKDITKIIDTINLRRILNSPNGAAKVRAITGLAEYSPLKPSQQTGSTAPLTSIPRTNFLSTTAFIDGTALFLKQRIREELALSFFDKMKTRLDSVTLLQRLFPSTFKLLKGIANMDNTLPSLNTLAFDAFQSDMEALPEDIEMALLKDPFFHGVIEHDEAFKYFALPFNAVKHVKNGSHPAFILDDLREKYCNDTSEIDRVMQMMVTLNDNLRTTDNSIEDDNVWIKQNQWTTLKKSPDGLLLFMGIMFQKNKNTLFNDLKMRPKTEITRVLLRIGNEMDEYIAQLNAFENHHFGLKIAQNRATSDSLGLELGWSLVQLIDRSHNIYFSILDDTISRKSQIRYWETYKPITEATLKTLSALQRKNYAGAMLNGYEILRGLSEIKNWKEGNVFGNKHIKTFFFYANFMTDVLYAQSSNDIRNILDRYAAPVGSYSVKRRNTFTVSVNAYPGLFAGWEKPLKPQLLRGVKASSFVSGVTAPIGLAANWGGLGVKKNKTATIFMPIIDIGAVLSYRWANDASQGLPQSIEWAQILSPGLQISYGIPNMPLAFMAGYQISPKLRKVDTGAATPQKTDFWRITFGITTDITIFNFYSNGRKPLIQQ